MADPFTLSFIAANCAWAMIQNRADAAAVGSATRLAEALRKQKTPANHDVLIATHTAFVRSIQLMADACERSGGDAKDQFAARALVKVVKDRDFTTFSADARTIPKKELDANIRAIFEGANADFGRNATEVVIARLEQSMREPLTDTFRTLFREGSDKHQSWPQAFELFFAEQVKTNERVFRTLAFDRLNEILALAEARASETAALHDTIDAFRGEVHGRFDSIDYRLGDMAGNVKEILARLSRQEQDAPIALLRSLAEAFGEARPEANAAELETYLRVKITDYHQLRERIETVQHEDNHDAALLAEANLAIKQGDFDRADHLLRDTEDLLDERVDRFLIRKSERRALRGDAAKLKGDYRSAVQHYDSAGAMLPETARLERLRRAQSAAAAVQEWGERIEPQALQDAVRRRRSLALILDRGISPKDWAVAQAELAQSLSTLGARRGSTEDLEESVRIYQSTLEVLTKQEYPDEWGSTQNNLGITLQTLGDRSEGTAVLDRAVNAYRCALEIYKREDHPEIWGAVQNNLGVVLARIGERQPGFEVLDQAADAFEAALKVRTRELMPWEWALTQNNLGNVLQTRTERAWDEDLVNKSISSFHGALEIFVREDVPLYWAIAQNNLGISLQQKGVAKKDSGLLKEAIASFRLALEIRTREEVPFQWAITLNNLGSALGGLGVLEDDAGTLEESVSIFSESLEVFQRDRMPFHWARAMENIGLALNLMARLAGDSEVAARAEAAFESALEVFAHPELQWNRGKAERGLIEARFLQEQLRGR